MCNCIEKVNEKLKERNAMVNSSINLLNPSAAERVAIQVLALQKSKSVPNLFATYCPFCGEKYEAEQGATT